MKEARWEWNSSHKHPLQFSSVFLASISIQIVSRHFSEAERKIMGRSSILQLHFHQFDPISVVYTPNQSLLTLQKCHLAWPSLFTTQARSSQSMMVHWATKGYKSRDVPLCLQESLQDTSFELASSPNIANIPTLIPLHFILLHLNSSALCLHCPASLQLQQKEKV